MYKETIDEISEDLIKEALSKDDDFKQQVKKKRKEASKVVKANKKQDKLKDGKSLS